MDDSTKLLNDFNHRITLTTEESKEIENAEKTHDRNIDAQRKRFEKEIERVKKEFADISEETHELVKAVYHLGSLLKDKVSKRELDVVQAKVDSWKLEEFIRHDELEKTFTKYNSD